MSNHTETIKAVAASPAWRVTKQQRQREQTIDRLLASSKYILQRDGHAMFTLRAVAAHAGMRLSNLQHYFSTKEQLLVETVRNEIEIELARYRTYAEAGGKAGLTGLLDFAFELVSDPVQRGLVVEFWALTRHSEEISSIISGRFKEYFDLIVNMVHSVNPNLSRAKASTIAEVCLGNLQGIIITSLTLGALRSDYRQVRDLILTSWQLLCDNAE